MSTATASKNIYSSSLLKHLLHNENRTSFDVLDTMPKNETIVNNILIAWSKINSPMYQNICCSVSGGSDSDLLVDICVRCDVHHKVRYVWFDTGLEYQATKDHLDFLEKKYGIVVERYKAIKPIPLSCKEYGQPFVSKQVSEFIFRLQKYGFQWEDEDFITLLNRYCKIASADKATELDLKLQRGKTIRHWAKINGTWYSGCVSALAWWCNEKCSEDKKSQFNISRNTYLKEFLMENPPKDIKISNKCCKYAKKDVSHALIKKMGFDLMIVGVRKAEGGARATAYKNCFTHHEDKCDEYRPIFFYSNTDKVEYNHHCGIVNSGCYTKYGLCRTGCVGCPYGRNLKEELDACKDNEPKLYTAVTNVFADSYEYTKQYREFQKAEKKKKKGSKEDSSEVKDQIIYTQINIFDFLSA